MYLTLKKWVPVVRLSPQKHVLPYSFGCSSWSYNVKEGRAKHTPLRSAQHCLFKDQNYSRWEEVIAFFVGDAGMVLTPMHSCVPRKTNNSGALCWPTAETVTCHMIWRMSWWFWVLFFSCSVLRQQPQRWTLTFRVWALRKRWLWQNPPASSMWQVQVWHRAFQKSPRDCLKMLSPLHFFCKELFKKSEGQYIPTDVKVIVIWMALMLIQEEHKKWRASSCADLWYWQHLSYELQAVVLSL